MDISFQSLFFFIIITILYFVFPNIGKPQLTIADLEETAQIDFYIKKMKSLAFYLGAVVFSQLFLNIGFLMSKCGGSLDQNIGSAAIFTFIPWILIFGCMLAVLIIFPGFKSAFSDVIGYYAISRKANDLLNLILKDREINEAIENDTNGTNKSELSSAADAIIKICGNKSLIINQIDPDNFKDMWETFKPLMKNMEIYNDNSKEGLKQQLLDLVVIKDNIGEAIWYIYTCILISSIVYYNLSTRGCVKNVTQLKKEHDDYIKQKESDEQKQEKNNSTEYIIN